MTKHLLIPLFLVLVHAIPVTGGDTSEDWCDMDILAGNWEITMQVKQHSKTGSLLCGEMQITQFDSGQWIAIISTYKKTTYKYYYFVIYDTLTGTIYFKNRYEKYIGHVSETKGYVFIAGIWFDERKEHPFYARKVMEK